MEGDRLEPAVTIKNIERELICPACKELFTHPVILPCQHSICHKCVKEILYFSLEDSFNDSASETSNQSSPRNRMHSPSLDKIDRVNRSASQRRSLGWRGWKRNSLTPKTTVFPCPGCRHDIDLGERGISGLFRNFTLETIVERYRQAARAATAIMCDLCKPPPQESTKSCMDCSASYCNECFKIHHPWGTLKAQHEYVGPTTNFRPKILMCPEHEMERVNMYCELCKRPVCHLCKLGGTHANHRVTTMSSAYKILKEKLSKDIDYLISKESQVKSQITELGLLMKEAECNGERAKEEASNNFDKLFDVLEERRATALRAIEASKNMRLEKLQSQIEEYQGLLENNGLVGYAQEVLKETDQSCFVQTAKQLHERIQRATESLRSFRPAAQASFEDFVVDIAKQQEALGDLSFQSSGVEIPEINEEQTKMYNKALISWDQPQKISSADTYILEYRKLNREETPPVWQEREVFSKSEIVSDLDTNSSYAFRVRGYKGSICSPWSREVILHTPPAPVFSFLFDDKCGYNAEHLILNMRRNAVENRAGFPLLLGADRIQAGCYTTLDYIIGDTGIVKGKHFWAFHVEPYSYFVKAGVASDVKIQEWFHNSRDLTSPRFQLRDRGRKNCHQEEKGQKEVEGGRMEKRYEQDSGHDSGSEDIFVESLQPFTLVTLGMKKFFIPKASPAPVTPKDAVNRILPMPSSIGICLDCDKGKVGFYDADRMKCLYERQVDCSGTMYPAFALMGSAGIHLEETIAAKYLQYQDEDM
ncbi:E3 ubiquitin-protein ligase TRIM36 isoform X3 [Anolis sagrei]|uniref:E3 ubiquitin-protein ligase TRIM36 isoform X3 n=1 Tax=Anolis sagrei TaxID=38937 RepID=UPI00295C0714|nr:E3 ubiquitin-protein ligase TRIM36 isoform X3 [Anolis sagrei ordinatus]